MAAGNAGSHDHFITGFPAEIVRLDLVDRAGDFRSRCDRQRELVSGDAAPHPYVEMIQSEGANADSREAGAGRRVGKIGDLESIEPAVLANENAFHEARIIRVPPGTSVACDDAARWLAES